MERKLSISIKDRIKKPKMLQKSLDEYYYARIEEKAKELEHIYDNLPYAPATEIEQARREISCLDTKLVKSRTKWAEESKVLNNRWESAQKKYDAIFQSLPKLNGYFKDSFIKRDRSLLARDIEVEQIDIKNRDICRLRKEIEKLDKEHLIVQQRLEKFAVFEIYLKKVKETSQGEYQDVREIIDRFSILADARKNLTYRNENTRNIVQNRQKKMVTDIMTKSNEVLAYRNYLSELLQYHSQLQDQVQTLDDNLLRIKTTAAQRTLVIGQIKMAIQNLYFQVCRHMHRIKKISPEDTLGQLSDIKISVIEMYKLSKDIKHMLKAAYHTAEGERAAKEKAQRKDDERQKRNDRLRRIDKSGNSSKPLTGRELFGLKRKTMKARQSKIDINLLKESDFEFHIT